MRSVVLIWLLSFTFISAASDPKCSLHLEYEAASVTRGMNLATPALLGMVADRNRQGNLLISPFNVLQALQALALGGGPLAKNLADFLGVDTLSDSQVAAGFSAVNAKLNEVVPQTKLRTSLSLWANAPFEIPKQFQKALERTFGASAESLDFSAPETLKAINRSVAERTDQMIPQLLARLDARTKLLLTSTLSIEGKWQTPFASVRHDVEFRSDSNGPMKLDMMSVQSRFRFAHGRAFDIVQLPTRDQRVILEIYVPKFENSRQTFLSDGFERVPLESKLVALRLPKFRLTSTQSLLEPLDQLTHLAQLELADQLRVTEFQHAAVLEVGVDGLRGTAASAVGVIAMGMSPRPDARMVVDRSFGLRVLFSEAPSTLEVFRAWVDQPEPY